MAKTKVHLTLREAILQGVIEATEKFNRDTFPQKSDEWTTEQKQIWEALNGESSWFTALHDSHKAEVRKQLTKLAGLEGMESRFDKHTEVNVPPGVMIILREGMSGYPSSFPILHGRAFGYWLENGSGGTDDIHGLTVKHIRPATVDDIRSFFASFPSSKISKLAHSVRIINEDKLREEVYNMVIQSTDELRKKLEFRWPDGMTEKAKKILPLVQGELTPMWINVLSIILDDPLISDDVELPPTNVSFPWLCAIVPITNNNAHNYELNKVYIQSGSSNSRVFFNFDLQEKYGNQMDSAVTSFRVPTNEEIQECIKSISPNDIRLFISYLSEDVINTLI